MLDPAFRDEVLRYKYRGSSGEVNLALDGLPELACKPGVGEWLRGAISFSPSIDYIEHAYDDAKYGRPSKRPYIDCIMPTLVDPTMAPPGKHVMSCFVQYAPYHLADGNVWDDRAREDFGQNVIDTLEERFPDIRSKIVGYQFVTPKDIEDITGLTEGNIFQGELSLEQLFFARPVSGWSQYKTANQDLWMCGSATHPGGGIMGALTFSLPAEAGPALSPDGDVIAFLDDDAVVELFGSDGETCLVPGWRVRPDDDHG